VNNNNWENNIIIAGTGIAAAAVASRLLSYNFHPLLLSRKLPHLQSIEAIPESALRLFDAVDLTPALEMAGGIWVEGFENNWHDSPTVIRSGHYIHVERSSLARSALAIVMRRGATVVSCDTIAPLTVATQSVHAIVNGVRQKFAAAIDATGRSALWSRPIDRRRQEIAQIYRTCGGESLLRGRITQLPGGWAYRLGLPDITTVGVVSSQHHSDAQNFDLIRECLCLPPTSLHPLGRRSVSPQWAVEPIQARRLAVGDAALAYSPIAGQGIRFALSSSLAAAAVVRTWRDSSTDRDDAMQYYRELVNKEKLQHLSHLDSFSSDRSSIDDLPVRQSIYDKALPSTVYYTGQTQLTQLYVNGSIECTEAILLPDRSLVRWLANFDLLTMRQFCAQPISTTSLIDRSICPHLSRHEAIYLIHWCLEHHILSTIDRFKLHTNNITTYQDGDAFHFL
jgi:hypothetical protein